MNKKTAVAVSGGIDSLVAAFLLKNQGIDVFGIHFVTGFEKEPVLSSGCSGIKKISDQLGIPVHVIDIKKEFSTIRK